MLKSTGKGLKVLNNLNILLKMLELSCNRQDGLDKKSNLTLTLTKTLF
jgi:hypothetical protein